MADFDITSLVYLVILLAAVIGWFLAEFSGGFGRMLRMMMAWGLIFLGVVAGYGLWSDVRTDLIPQQTVVADGTAIETERHPGGHFHLTVSLNGVPVDFLVDTGATDIVLMMEDAERVGLDPDTLPFIGRARTANGEVATAYTTIDEVTLGPVTHRNVPVAVNEGEMPGSLLGMSYLSRFDRIEISDNVLTLTP